ncbi:MAG: hypothetical protein RL088_2148 [Verrucomicrobiota bacterium]|jgi:hypothetical protein
MKKILATLLIATAVYSNAATVNWGAATDNGFSVGGADLAQGNWARIGYFNLSDSQIQANAFNLSFLNSNFTEFASVQLGEGFGIDGHFSASSNANPAALAGAVPNIVGQQIYYWILSASAGNRGSVSVSLANATAQGIYYVNKTQNSAWAFPSQTPVPGFTTTDITDLTNAAGTALATGATVVVGGFGGETSDATASPNFTLAPVPEPTSAFLIAVGAAGLMMRRRRQS